MLTIYFECNLIIGENSGVNFSIDVLTHWFINKKGVTGRSGFIGSNSGEWEQYLRFFCQPPCYPFWL